MQQLAARRPLMILAALFMLGGAVRVSGLKLAQWQVEASREMPIYLPKARYLRPMSLGYQNVLADLLWFRTISYFGKHYRSDRTYPWLAYMCDLVTDLDPRAEHVYRFAGVILPWEVGQADAGIRLLEKGTLALPDSWLLHYYLGFNHFYFENDFDRALASLRRASELPGAHPQVAALATVLAAEQYGPQTTLKFLSELERTTPSEDVREIIRQQMRQVRLTEHLARINAAIRTYRDLHDELPPNLETLVREELLPEIPEDPFGGRYLLDAASGEARSSTGVRPSRLHRSKMREKVIRHGSTPKT